MKQSRLHSVDIFRGLALVFMVGAHTSIGTHTEAIPFFGFMAAPSFLFISGFSYDLFLLSRLNDKKFGYWTFFRESFSRGLLIYVIPLIPYVLLYVFTHRYEFNFIHWGIFEIIGVGYIIGGLKIIRIREKILLTILIFITSLSVENLYPDLFSFLLNGPFPILPWIGYFMCGRVAYEVTQSKCFGSDQCLLVFGFAPILASLIVLYNYDINLLDASRDQLSTFAFITSIQLFILFLLVFLVDRKNVFLGFFNSFEQLGKLAFTFYYVHFPIIIVLGVCASKFQIHSNMTVLLITTLILLVLERIWRPYNYKYGMEWLIKTGSNRLVHLG